MFPMLQTVLLVFASTLTGVAIHDYQPHRGPLVIVCIVVISLMMAYSVGRTSAKKEYDVQVLHFLAELERIKEEVKGRLETVDHR